MNEKKKIIILLSVVVALIAGVIIYDVIDAKRSSKYLNSFYEAYNGTENKLVVIGREGCSWCQVFKPTVDLYKESYGFDYLYLDTGKVNSSSLAKLLKDLDVKSDEFGTPLTVVVNNKTVVDSISGYADEDSLLEFLKKNGFVKNDVKTFLNYIDYSSYSKLINSSKNSIIVVGQTSCGYCIQSKPVLQKIAKEKNIVINYLNITDLSESDSESFQTSLDYLKDNEWGTPLTLIVSKGNVRDSINGTKDYDGYMESFKNNGFIKE